MTRITADLAALADTEAAFRVVLGAFEETLSELETSLQVHLADWSGDARHAFTDFHDLWHTSARELAGRLDHLRHGLGAAHNNFGSARSTSLRMWRSA